MNFESLITTINKGVVLDRDALKLDASKPRVKSPSLVSFNLLRAYFFPARCVATRGYISYSCLNEISPYDSIPVTYGSAENTLHYGSHTSSNANHFNLGRENIGNLIDKDFEWQLTYQKPENRVQKGIRLELDNSDMNKIREVLVSKFNWTSKYCVAVHDAIRGKLVGMPLDPLTYKPAAPCKPVKPFDPFEL